MNVESDANNATGNHSPLWIRRLASHQENTMEFHKSFPNGSYRAIQRLVTKSPNDRLPDAEIETVLEAFLTKGGECLWRRVAVWSGPNNPSRVLHASFVLPNDEATQNSFFVDENDLEKASNNLHAPSRICWAAFPERPDHKLLCVLVNPTTLSIWDAYPDGRTVYVSGEGHSVSLPFQCSSIHALGGSHGLLLQRKDDQEDLDATKASAGFENMDISSHARDEEKEFFLKVPKRKMGLDDVASVAPTCKQEAGSLPVHRTSGHAPTGVSSLFSLKHPLEDVLPVSHFNEHDTISSLVTDVFEKIIYTGTLRWTDPSSNGTLENIYFEQPICVTYHTILKRHAIWALRAAPEPSATLPLWQRSRRLRSTRAWDSHIGMMDQDLDDMELLGVMDPSLNRGTTHDEALADALGVRRTPRRSTEVSTRGRALEPRTRNRSDPSSANRSGYMRPSKDGSFIDMETSVVECNAPLLNLGPMSNLHPNVAIECLFEEGAESEAAVNVLLASNIEGNGLLMLSLVVPSGDVYENPNSLRLVSIEPSLLPKMREHQLEQSSCETIRNSHTFVVKVVSSVACKAAQAIDSSPVPACFQPKVKPRKTQQSLLATDILILRKSHDDSACLSLFRGQCHIVDCALMAADGTIHNGYEPCLRVDDIKNSVGSNVDFVIQEGEDKIFVRGRLSLELSSGLSENVLSAIESSLVLEASSTSDVSKIECALRLRADCVRLEQTIRMENNYQIGACNDMCWAAVAWLLNTVISLELSGSAVVAERGCGSSLPNNSLATEASPWSSLLDSSFHESYSFENESQLFRYPQSRSAGKRANSSSPVDEKRDLYEGWLLSQGSGVVNSVQTGTSITSNIFDSLHFLYEELKLCTETCKGDHMRSVASVLVATCQKYRAAGVSCVVDPFFHHYARDLGESWLKQKLIEIDPGEATIKDIRMTSFDTPPCIFTWLDALLNQETLETVYNAESLSTVNATCSRTRLLLHAFGVLFRSEKTQLERDRNVVALLYSEGFESLGEIRDEFPAGVALPILETLNRCKDCADRAIGSDWTAAEFSLIERLDLNRNISTYPASQHILYTIPVRVSEPDNPTYADVDKDGLVPLQVSSAMLFPRDNRVKEAGRLLRSARPCFLSVPRSVEISDHEYERLKQHKLLLLCRRVLALPVGRGMMTIGSFQPVAAEPLPIPDLCLVGRVPPQNAHLGLDMTECQQDIRIWPDFHNGVAAGLRLPLAEEIGDSVSKITRTWIVYNRPSRGSESHQNTQNSGQPSANNNQSHAHGGFLLALGLRGHLSALEMTDIYDYLTQGVVTLSCGVLLGMAANKRGSCDISVSKMLCLHLPSLIPQHFSAIDVASAVQTAAVLGAGLLFQGSSHRMMTEFLLNEIGRRPESDVALDREGYTLCCGLALGMVNICKGANNEACQNGSGSEGLADLRIAERLYRYIVGGTDEDEIHRTREANDRLNMPTTSSTGETERCSCVFEGDSINIDVTAAGATLALGLIFLRSGNQNVASSIALPDTHFLLEFVRPDFLALRVIARALILWHDVEPSQEWIERQLPTVIRDAYKQMKLKIKTATMGDLNSSDEESDSIADETSDSKPSRRRQQQAQDFDAQAVRQIYVYVVAGACFGLGLRFAGTADVRAKTAIFDRILELQKLRDASDSVSLALRPEIQILETCLGCCAISLAMINAGTGDLDAFKLLKMLRWRCDEQVKYGTHMSYSMAIGLLFLGGGSCTLGREPEDIAALVAAFFPRYPFTTTDNQYHLQALRHLYALAVKRRDLRFVDADTGKIVAVPVEIAPLDGSSRSIQLTTPCLVPNIEATGLEARITTEEYYPLKLKLCKNVFGKTHFVKRRIGFSLSKGMDGVRQPLLVHSAGNFDRTSFVDLAQSMPGNPYVLAFSKYLCAWSSKKRSLRDASIEDFCKSGLKEYLAGHSEMSLAIYLRLRSSLALIETSSSSSSLFLWDFRLIRSYYEIKSQRSGSSPAILNIEKIAHLTEFAERIVQGLEPQGQIDDITRTASGRSQILGDTKVL